MLETLLERYHRDMHVSRTQLSGIHDLRTLGRDGILQISSHSKRVVSMPAPLLMQLQGLYHVNTSTEGSNICPRDRAR